MAMQAISYLSPLPYVLAGRRYEGDILTVQGNHYEANWTEDFPEAGVKGLSVG